MRLTLAEMASAIGAEILSPTVGQDHYEGLCTDTRALKKGEVFLALRGERFDGNRFAEEAIAKGASCLILNQELREVAKNKSFSLPILFVPDTLRALGDLAAHWRRKFKIPVLAITGSNGKTTTRSITGTMLAHHFRVHQSQGNLNNLIGAPLTILNLARHHEVFVVELGMNHFGEIARLTEIAKPTHALITNIGPVHLEFLGTLEGVAKAKGELFHGMDSDAIALINQDDAFCTVLAQEAKINSARRLTFGWKNKADIFVEHVKPLGENGIEGNIVFIRDRRPHHDCHMELKLPLAGAHNVYNLLAAVAAARSLGVTAAEITNAVYEIKPVGSRSHLIRLSEKRLLLDDCYNANLASMKAALNMLEELRGSGPSIAVLGEMLELGKTAQEAHFELGKWVAKTGVTELFTIGEHAQVVAQGASEKGMDRKSIHLVYDGLQGMPPDDLVEAMVVRLRSKMVAGSSVLVKGSRGMALERVVKSFASENITAVKGKD